MRKNASSRSFQAFGFEQRKGGGKNGGAGASGGSSSAGGGGGAGGAEEDTVSNSGLPRRGSHINVNIAPTTMENDTPEIRKYKKRFNSDILCAALWGE